MHTLLGPPTCLDRIAQTPKTETPNLKFSFKKYFYKLPEITIYKRDDEHVNVISMCFIANQYSKIF